MVLAELPDDTETPCTVVLVERLERNLAEMAAFARRLGVALRPHAKTHKCAEIARRQLAHGACGLSVATLGEAEVLVRRGAVDDVFIAYPVLAHGSVRRRLEALCAAARVAVGVDSVEACASLGPLAGSLEVVVEVDCGLRRSGVEPSRAGEIARAALRAGLEVRGAFTFPGQSYGPGLGASAAEAEAAALGHARAVLGDVGTTGLLRSGGSTPSARWTVPGALDELRPGVYALGDAQQVQLGTMSDDDVALVVAARVVSRAADHVVLDAGSKVLGADRPAWVDGFGRLLGLPGARITGLWEHHAVVEGVTERLALGDVVAVVPNHVCTAVNLVDGLLAIEPGGAAARWAVDARGANR